MKFVLNLLLTKKEAYRIVNNFMIDVILSSLNDVNLSYHIHRLEEIITQNDEEYILECLEFESYFEITDSTIKSIKNKITSNLTESKLRKADNLDCLNIIKYLSNYVSLYKQQYSHLYIETNKGKIIDINFTLPKISYDIENPLPNVILFKSLYFYVKYIFIVFDIEFYDHVKRNNLSHLFEHVIGKDITKTALVNQNGLTYSIGNMGYFFYHHNGKELTQIFKRFLTNVYKLRYIDVTSDSTYVKEINHQISRHMNELYNSGCSATEHVYSNYSNNVISLYDIAYVANRDYRIYSFDFSIDLDFINEMESKYPKRNDMKLTKIKIPSINLGLLLHPLHYYKISANNKINCLMYNNITNWRKNKNGEIIEGICYDKDIRHSNRFFMISQESLYTNTLHDLIFSYPSYEDLLNLYKL